MIKDANLKEPDYVEVPEYTGVNATLNGRVVMKVAEFAGIKKAEAEKCIKQVKDAVSKWEAFAEEAGLSKTNTERISKFFNLDI